MEISLELAEYLKNYCIKEYENAKEHERLLQSLPWWRTTEIKYHQKQISKSSSKVDLISDIYKVTGLHK